GDRRLTLTEAAGIIQEEQRDGGRILVPAFSVGRTQNLLHALSNLTHEGLIPEIPIYVDSPLATKATRVAAAHRELYDDETQEMLERGRDPFYFDSVRFVADVEESKSLGELSEGIIISASGMCEAGRILHHLSRSLGQKRDCVLAAGYMAQGTLGRRLVDGHEIVRVFGVRHRVECKVRSVPGLSAHADWRELLESLGHLASSVRRVFVVHGEEDPAIRFSHRLLDAGFAEVEVPVHKQIFEL
ncbi:MAG: MBL fold metallo-hydrolase RNA specificity domain-containing protein, partial [Planctomycetota bacterium]